jgi:hypothetical protein
VTNPIMTKAMCATCFFGLCYVGVELGCGGQQRGEGQGGRAVPTDRER